MAYPHAPESPYPAQIVSTLKVLNWLKNKMNIDKVSIIGESAGATLGSVATGLIYNKIAYDDFYDLIKNVYHYKDGYEINKYTYPEITTFSSWYGILDSNSYKNKGLLWWGLQFTVDSYRGYSPFPKFLVHEHNNDKTIDNYNKRHECKFLTIVDMIEADYIINFPPTLIISGLTDPLGLKHSATLCSKLLYDKCPIVNDHENTKELELHKNEKTFNHSFITTKNTENTVRSLYLHEFEAGHAFIGLNPFVLWTTQNLFQFSDWRLFALPAVRLQNKFLDYYSNKGEGEL